MALFTITLRKSRKFCNNRLTVPTIQTSHEHCGHYAAEADQGFCMAVWGWSTRRVEGQMAGVPAVLKFQKCPEILLIWQECPENGF